MKNHLLKLKITHGEYQFDQLVLLPVAPDASAEDTAENYARTFYGVPCDEATGRGAGYYFHLGEVHVSVLSVTEITDDEASVLARFL